MKMNSYLVPLFGAVAFLAMAGCSDDEVIQQENNRPQGKGTHGNLISPQGGGNTPPSTIWLSKRGCAGGLVWQEKAKGGQ